MSASVPVGAGLAGEGTQVGAAREVALRDTDRIFAESVPKCDVRPGAGSGPGAEGISSGKGDSTDGDEDENSTVDVDGDGDGDGVSEPSTAASTRSQKAKPRSRWCRECGQ